MEVEDIKDRTEQQKDLIDKKMQDVFNDNKALFSDKYHQYKFKLPNIKQFEFDRQHYGRSQDHINNCKCYECKKIR